MLASHYLGLALAYESGLRGNDDDLRRALRRNLYATVEPTPAQIDIIVDYIRSSSANLTQEPLSYFNAGTIKFAPTLSCSIRISGTDWQVAVTMIPSNGASSGQPNQPSAFRYITFSKPKD